MPNELFCDSETPLGWGVLIERDNVLKLHRKPAWHETTAESQVRFLQRIAVAGTRQFNRALGITREEILATSKAFLSVLIPPGRSRFRPVISVGCSRPSKKSIVGATSARMPSPIRNFAAFSAT